MICQTCRRALGEPSCASPEHKRIEREIAAGWLNPDGTGKRGSYASSRASRKAAALSNYAEPIVGSKVGKSHCGECNRWLPNDHFWNRKTKVRTLKCGWCLRKRRTQHPARLAAKAIARKTRAEVDAYWEGQSQAHL